MVNGRPPIFCKQLSNSTISIGKVIRLECVAIGNPKPEIQWMRNGERVNAWHREHTRINIVTTKLEVYGALPVDSGYYTCIASNSFGHVRTGAFIRISTEVEVTSSYCVRKSNIKGTTVNFT